MSVKVKCSRCGTVNEINRVFCLKCGDKLDLARAITENQRHSARRYLSIFVRWVVILLILSAVGLVLWPVEPRGERGSVADADKMTGEVGRFYQAVQNRSWVDGVITEAEVNAYLAEVMKQNEKASQSERFRLGAREINVAFTRDHLKVLVLANWGPVSLSFEIKGIPFVKGGRFNVMVQEARWGHMPLPGPAVGWLSRRVAGMFFRVEKELAILNSLDRFDLGNGRVYITTRGVRRVSRWTQPMKEVKVVL